MNCDDLQKAVSEALASGQIGTPVSLRAHWQLADPNADLVKALAIILRVAEPAFSRVPDRLTARRGPDERQIHVLLHYADGKTALITLGRGSVQGESLHWLLIGNHGIMRLEGAEMFEATGPLAETGDVDRFRAAIDRSVQSRASVAFAED